MRIALALTIAALCALALIGVALADDPVQGPVTISPTPAYYLYVPLVEHGPPDMPCSGCP